MSDDSFEIICPRCRASVPADAEICPACGHELITRPVRAATASTAARPADAQPPEDEDAARQAFERIRELSAHVPPSRAVALAPSAYAGFWIRVLASLIDEVLILGAVFVTVELGARTLAGLVIFAGVFLYYPLMEASDAQGTIGKLVLGLAVTDTAGRRISYARAYGRVFGRIVCAVTGNIGYLLVAFTSRKQGLHDLIAGTLVLHRGFY